MGTTPARLTSPTVGLIPTTPLWFAGPTMLPSVSIGTETDGSTVCPANHIGVVGIKPTVGLGADRDGGEVRRGCGARAGARAAGVAVDGVRVVALSAAARPAARGREAAKVGPLAQGGLPQDDGAGGA